MENKLKKEKKQQHEMTKLTLHFHQFSPYHFCFFTIALDAIWIIVLSTSKESLDLLSRFHEV